MRGCGLIDSCLLVPPAFVDIASEMPSSVNAVMGRDGPNPGFAASSMVHVFDLGMAQAGTPQRTLEASRGLQRLEEGFPEAPGEKKSS